MTQAFTKTKLSASTNGQPIKVAATASPGTLIHTAVSGTSAWDEIFLYAFNSSGASVVLTIEYGGATAPDQNIVQAIPAQSGIVLVVPGLLLQNGLTVKAFAATANVITISGYVHNIV